MAQQNQQQNHQQNQLAMQVDEHVPQTEQLRMDQTLNNAGGFVWAVDDMKRFRRFVVLGSETPTYKTDDRKLGRENAESLLRLLKNGKGIEVVNEILKYSVEGRTAKLNPLIFAFAFCARLGDLKTKQRAYEVLDQICRIPTHLFLFVVHSKILSKPGSGWGKASRKAIKKWYTQKEAMKLAMDVTKYQKREGWSHADIARVTHPKSDKPSIQCVLKYAVRGYDEMIASFPMSQDNTNELETLLNFFKAVEEIKQLTTKEEDRVVELIEGQNLVREHVPTGCLGSMKVWNALLKKMPMTAMIRNLNKMTSIGLLAEGSPQVKDVCDKLQNEDLLRNARIHPFNVLLALKTYESGKGEKGSLEWKANVEITKALEKAFYLSFKNVEPTGKSYMLAMDVSGSMQASGCIGASTIKPHVASAAMAMVTARTEEHHEFVAFSHEIVPMKISSNMNLDEVLKICNEIPMGSTDCAQPMLYALYNNLKIDVFIVYTDSETYYGKVHPREALKQYRHHSGIDDAKLIVVAMTSNGFTIADPDDPGMLDIVGFDSAAPQVMKEFILGNI
ncbi:60 kDa SS-A/Ro ribonucleoprotein-like [Xenia sp. Carnegie-2017]|uniref:60 kDa SS-A/Ro ribonucleoprotein-like n=1 Tax=Xenia sp. Carnegie-2017 TaxID=2897299 RepID=UPI001F0409AC|nr:60 kDa SS-A/Ro ribonucleoprotein-like [Xenia sp. Carnegie-2017]